MALNMDQYIQNFWNSLKDCKSKHSYKLLLEQSELLCVEQLSQSEGEEFKSFYEESPLLAMVSEIQKRCPEAVDEKAEESLIFSTAAYILSTYNEDDRKFLREHFLGKKEDDNVIYLDFKDRKKG